MSQSLPPLLLAMIEDSDCPNGILSDALQEYCSEWMEGDKLAIVYVVTGETGEYSSWMTWNVSAYLDERAARARADELNKWCADRSIQHLPNEQERARRDQMFGELNWWAYHMEIEKSGCPLDPKFHCDSNGTIYSVVEIPLKG